VFVDDLAELLPKTILRETIYNSVSWVAGSQLTAEVLDQLCWRLAGNTKLLAAGEYVTPWTRQRYKERVPLQILSAKRARNRKGDAGHVFKFRVLAGYPTGLLVVKFWSDRLARYVASQIGFARRMLSDQSDKLPAYVYHHPLELVTLRLIGLIDPQLCQRHELGFETITISAPLRAYNRDQLKFRDRLDKAHACPCGFSFAQLCFRCPKGYGSEKRCRAGCHRLDYTFAFCAGCRRNDAPFDPEQSVTLCIECLELEAMQKT
jgi:hypothetical protein